MGKNVRSEAIQTVEFRVFFDHLLEPRMNKKTGAKKYGLTMAFPKTADISPIWAAVQSVAQQMWPQQWQAILQQSNPIKDGDTVVYQQGTEDVSRIGKRKCEFYPEFAGHWIIDASSNEPVGVVDRNSKAIMDPRQWYSGCYAWAQVNAYTYQNERAGVGIGLQCVQKLRDGEHLGNGNPDATKAFAPLPPMPGQAPAGMPMAPAPQQQYAPAPALAQVPPQYAAAPGAPQYGPVPTTPGAVFAPMPMAPAPAPQGYPGVLS